MAILLQADEPIKQIGNTLALAVLQAPRELCLAQADRRVLVSHGVTEGELQRCDREGVRVRLACEKTDYSRTLLEWEESSNCSSEDKEGENE